MKKLFLKPIYHLVYIISCLLGLVLCIGLLTCIPVFIIYIIFKAFDLLVESLQTKLGINPEQNLIYDDDGEEHDLEAWCGDCHKKLTLVRPGKHQCDNPNCIQNI